MMIHRALSVRQPWAWLIVNRWKPIENRTWFSTFRGPLLIHAAKAMTRGDYEACWIFCGGLELPATFQLPAFDSLERGGIVGQVDMTNCIQHSYDQWFTGPFGFVMDNQQALPFRPCKGSLGFFTPAYAA